MADNLAQKTETTPSQQNDQANKKPDFKPGESKPSSDKPSENDTKSNTGTSSTAR